MNLNGIELDKEDTKRIIEELKENKHISDYDKEYQDFIKECIKVSKTANER